MPANIAFPYERVSASNKLETAQESAITAVGANLTPVYDASNAQHTITVAAQTVNVFEVSGVRGVASNPRYADLNVTSPTDKATVHQQGRPDPQMTLTCVYDNRTNNVVDLFLKDPTGTRIVYVQRSADDVELFVGTILEPDEQPIDETTGEGIFTVRLVNAASEGRYRS